MRIGSLFSGIGGLELGLEQAGVGHTVWQVEKTEFCRKVLAKHWPRVERFEDVKEVGKRNLSEVDLLCGGFPCQDISTAGHGAGLSGSRSGLWFEYSRIISELDPRWVVVENVASGARRWVDQVSEELERLGYEVLPVPISAADVGAPHLRRRIFLIAHSDSEQLRFESGRQRWENRTGAPLPGNNGQERDAPNADGHRRQEYEPWRPAEEHGATASNEVNGSVANTDDNRESAIPIDAKASMLQESTEHSGWVGWPSVSPVCGVDARVPGRMDRLRALGNAVVPQCAEVIGHMIKEMNK